LVIFYLHRDQTFYCYDLVSIGIGALTQKTNIYYYYFFYKDSFEKRKDMYNFGIIQSTKYYKLWD